MGSITLVVFVFIAICFNKIEKQKCITYFIIILVFDVWRGSGCASGSLPSDGRENGVDEVEESSHMGHHLKYTNRSIKMPGCQKGSRGTYVSISVSLRDRSPNSKWKNNSEDFRFWSEICNPVFLIFLAWP